MSQQTAAFEPSQCRLERQAAESIDEDTDLLTAVRVFYSGFAVILYDMWLLVDLLIQVNIDIEQRLKPRVSARTFLNIVRKNIPVT